MRAFRCLRLCILTSLCLFAAMPARSENTAASPDAASITVAHVGDRAISLAELDRAGGRSLYDLSQQLYEARVRALYQLLSTELLEREAHARSMSADELLAREVTPQVTEVSDAEVEAFLASQGSGTPRDARGRKQAQLYLGMKRQADAKREYVSTLFQKHGVRVALDPPPPPPKEEVQGPVTPAIGKPDAPVTIVAFSDYRCPYCRDLSHSIDELLHSHRDQVRVVYRHFPLHEDSEKLAHATLCADEQGKFPEYHRRLFSAKTGAEDTAQIARELGLDLQIFDACMSATRYQARIEADLQEGRRLRINGTPTLFIDGQRLRGAQTLPRLTAAVQEALRAAQALRAPPSASNLSSTQRAR